MSHQPIFSWDKLGKFPVSSCAVVTRSIQEDTKHSKDYLKWSLRCWSIHFETQLFYLIDIFVTRYLKRIHYVSDERFNQSHLGICPITTTETKCQQSNYEGTVWAVQEIPFTPSTLIDSNYTSLNCTCATCHFTCSSRCVSVHCEISWGVDVTTALVIKFFCLHIGLHLNWSQVIAFVWSRCVQNDNFKKKNSNSLQLTRMDVRYLNVFLCHATCTCA